ncbi:hypothetical protein [Rhizobium sp. AAP43]|uniref:hypothetical protein n=1 Tax=Rhizobium sp. AAP43 TaxID=1523420 RepID=UPI0006B8B454|nr:hypothetical protein [Rhizobium sp. AAP43]
MNQRATTNTPSPPPALTPAQKTLCARAAELEPLLSPGWVSFRNIEEGRTEVMVEGDAENAPILALTEEASHADREMIVRGAQMVRALVAAGRLLKWRVAELKAEIRHLRGEPDPDAKSFSHAQQCGRYCNDPAFRYWLRDFHGADISDDKRVASHIRNKLQIESRAELDTNPAAARRWQSLLESFKRRQR